MQPRKKISFDLDLTLYMAIKHRLIDLNLTWQEYLVELMKQDLDNQKNDGQKRLG